MSGYGSLVDVVLVVLALLFGINGYRQGFVVGALSLLGFFSGALIGLQLAPFLAERLSDPALRVVVSLGAVFLLAVSGQILGAIGGSKLRQTITSDIGKKADDIGGALVSVLALLLVAWMVTAPMASSAVPGLAKSIRRSAILHGVDSAMPDKARSVYSGLRDVVDTNGFPDVFGGLSPTQTRAVPPPDPTLARSPVVQRARKSVAKVLGDADRCDRRIEGSGFVYAPEHVMTNAHVVAGTNSVRVEVDGDEHQARVVVYDPQRDLAVLYVPGLDAPVLPFTRQSAASGANAIVVGFPLNGPYRAEAARVREERSVRGPNIYDNNTVVREVYTIRARVISGNSGGPLLAADGSVYGVIFAAAADDQDTGFAITADEAASVAAAGRTATTRVGTQQCA